MIRIFLLGLTLMILPVISSNSLIACDPEDANYISGTYQYFKNGLPYSCEVFINFCCQWDDYLKEMDVIVEQIATDGSSSCIFDIANLPGFLNWVSDQIKDATESLCPAPWPPCDEQDPGWAFFIKFASCRKIFNQYHPNWMVGFKFCHDETDCKCVYAYQRCIDYTQNPPAYRDTYLPPYHDPVPCTINCQLEVPEMPPPGYTWQDDWETVCYYFDCL